MGSYIAGILMGVGVTLIAASTHDASLKKECEQNLPRSQKCILVAVPEK